MIQYIVSVRGSKQYVVTADQLRELRLEFPTLQVKVRFTR